MQQSLNAWRHRWLQKLKGEAALCMSRDQKLVLEARIDTYTHNVLQDNNPWHEKPQDALKKVQCEKVDDVGIPHWNCVLG
jgi:hypothetical protein